MKMIVGCSLCPLRLCVISILLIIKATIDLELFLLRGGFLLSVDVFVMIIPLVFPPFILKSLL
jgi:hypothetical protein